MPTRSPATRRPSADSVERSIYFYKVRNGSGDVEFDHRAILRDVEALPYTGRRRERYLVEEGGDELCAWIDDPSKMRFGRTRHHGLPQVEQQMQLTPIPIPSSAGINDVIHVMFFANDVVGADFNFHAPRISNLAWYLSEKCPGLCERVQLDPLPRPDVEKQLDKFDGLRLFSMRVVPSFIASLRQADQDIAQMFEAQLKAGEAKDYEIVIRTARNKTLSDKIMRFVRRIMRRSDVGEGVSGLTVGGTSRITGRMEAVDLLRDQLISKREIILEDNVTRALDSRAAYAAIASAYTELQGTDRRSIGYIHWMKN